MIAQLEQEQLEILRFGRSNSYDELKDYISKADFIFHLAGVNRPKDDSDFEAGNKKLTETILSLAEAEDKKIPILITSSIQAELSNPYGKSKKAAEDAAFDWARRNDSKVYAYRLPNVFGKWCKPYYNSVVATFCHNIANDLEIEVSHPDAEINLVYIDDVIDDFLMAMRGRKKISSDGFCHISRRFQITLKQLADKLYGFKESRKSLLVPDFQDDFSRFLYATYTSYLDKNNFSYKLQMRHDDRGWLAEFIKSSHFGQIFISRTKPGVTRGNHWHHTKIEKFLVIDGEAEIKFRKLDSKEIIRYKVDGKKLKVLDIPAGYTHSIKNIGKDDLLTVFWADEIFNPDKPDTYYLEV